jgi:hypothetical protein
MCRYQITGKFFNKAKRTLNAAGRVMMLGNAQPVMAMAA